MWWLTAVFLALGLALPTSVLGLARRRLSWPEFRRRRRLVDGLLLALYLLALPTLLCLASPAPSTLIVWLLCLVSLRLGRRLGYLTAFYLEPDNWSRDTERKTDL
ncbi:hypothetical protein AMJ57_02680 [Parcubacteria bacterium SG8_24]|nr:MAG: hypothetical protein AMJ57_02680 [Parcubacteria bacterium SG8_24]